MRKRGRPHKFGRPSRLVAIRLPEDVIAKLRAQNNDLAKAVVSMVGSGSGPSRKSAVRTSSSATAELLRFAPRRFLISVDRKAIGRLPGCELVPVGPASAFVALPPGQGLGDLGMAVVDRLEEPGLAARERGALLRLRDALRAWRRDRNLTYVTRAIVVVQRRNIARTAF